MRSGVGYDKRNGCDPLSSISMVKQMLGCYRVEKIQKKVEVMSTVWPDHKGVISEPVGKSKGRGR